MHDIRKGNPESTVEKAPYDSRADPLCRDDRVSPAKAG